MSCENSCTEKKICSESSEFVRNMFKNRWKQDFGK